MDTPIADAVSLFNEDPFSVTLGTKPEPLRGDKRFNDRTYYIDGRQPGGYSGEFPFAPNAHIVAQENTDPNKTFDVTLGGGRVVKMTGNEVVKNINKVLTKWNR